jgi:hypothetical protein
MCRPSSVAGSYEDLSDDKYSLELSHRKSTEDNQKTQDEAMPLNQVSALRNPNRVPKLLRQSSTMESPVDVSGAMKMTYWF